MKWQTNESLSCSKFAIKNAGSLLNHTLATPPEGGRERSAYNFIRGLLEVQDSLEGPYVVERLLRAIIEL